MTAFQFYVSLENYIGGGTQEIVPIRAIEVINAEGSVIRK